MQNNTHYTVILDTNVVNNENSDFTSFFGGKKLLKHLQNPSSNHITYTVVIPHMVIKELKKHKKDGLIEAMENIKSHIQYIQESNFSSSFNKIELNTKLKKYSNEQELDSLIENLLEQEMKNMSVIYLNKNQNDLTEIYQKIEKHVVNKLPPYREKKQASFKDTVILFTILEQQYTQEDNVYFLSNDEDFTSVFNSKDHIRVVKDKEFIDLTIRKELPRKIDKAILTKIQNMNKINDGELNNEQ